MPEIISINYYKEIMQQIHKAIDSYTFEQIMWFGDCHMVSLIYDYLAADGYLITAVLDNDPLKWGRIIERNWCMPFTFGYTDINKESVDIIVAGKTFPDLKIYSPYDIYNAKSFNEILFFTSSYRSNEMKQQLLSMGADVHKIIELPTEQKLWNEACNNLHSMTANKERLTSEKHRKVLLALLKEFKNYCEKESLRYCLGYGTLIGAVRHKGFIPWDDDIDILMPVEDYNKFIEGYQGNRKFKVLDYKINDEYFFPFAKFVDNDTYLHHEGCPITWMQEVYIDIFPLSGFEDGLSFEEQWRYQTLLDIKWYWYYVSREVVKKNINDCRDEIIREKHKIGYNCANNVGVLMTIPAKPWMMERETFDSICKLNFEDDFYNVPSNYDEYLKKIYGDYMKLPPLEEQKNHGFPSYRRLIN